MSFARTPLPSFLYHFYVSSHRVVPFAMFWIILQRIVFIFYWSIEIFHTLFTRSPLTVWWVWTRQSDPPRVYERNSALCPIFKKSQRQKIKNTFARLHDDGTRAARCWLFDVRSLFATTVRTLWFIQKCIMFHNNYSLRTHWCTFCVSVCKWSCARCAVRLLYGGFCFARLCCGCIFFSYSRRVFDIYIRAIKREPYSHCIDLSANIQVLLMLRRARVVWIRRRMKNRRKRALSDN